MRVLAMRSLGNGVRVAMRLPASRRWAAGLTAVFTLAAAVGCTGENASPASHDIIYQVSEVNAPPGETLTINYVDSSGDDQQETTHDTPWLKRFTTQESVRQQAILKAQGVGLGTVTCTVTVDGVDHTNKEIFACWVGISLANNSPIR
jgi:hypothetical protein